MPINPAGARRIIRDVDRSQNSSGVGDAVTDAVARIENLSATSPTPSLRSRPVTYATDMLRAYATDMLRAYATDIA
jgi:hypothetical protein